MPLQGPPSVNEHFEYEAMSRTKRKPEKDAAVQRYYKQKRVSGNKRDGCNFPRFRRRFRSKVSHASRIVSSNPSGSLPKTSPNRPVHTRCFISVIWVARHRDNCDTHILHQKTAKRPVRVGSNLGFSSLCVRAPSLLSNRRPLLSASKRPTGWCLGVSDAGKWPCVV